MPLYEYQCEKCGHRFEKIESVNASTTKKCPKCGRKAERLLAAPAIQFKGSGWYVTDYAGKGAPTASKDKDSSGDSGSTKSADAKTESKSPDKPAKESTSKKAKKE